MTDLTSAAVQAAIDDERIYSDSQVVHAGFTLKQLRDAFERCIAPADHWKAPITMIASTPAERELLIAAIEFHVGGPTTVAVREFSRNNEQVTLFVLTNAGYWSNVDA